MDLYDWLLFLHVLTAFALVGAVVVFAVLFAATRDGQAGDVLRLTPLGRRLWDVGGAGTLVFGVWLALNREEYGILDGWIIAALVLWAAAAGVGTRVGMDYQEGKVADSRTRLMLGAMAVLTALLLAVMIYKPGAG